MARLADDAVAAGGWLWACRGRDLRGKRVVAIRRHGVDLAVWRDARGRACAVDARCPHQGAALGRGRVADGRLACPLHGHAFAGDGGEARGRCAATAYAVAERCGAVFVRWGAEAPPLPEPPWTGPCRTRVVGPVPIAVHPHLATINGFDLDHLGPVHGFAAEVVEPARRLDRWRLRTVLRLRGGAQRLLPGEPPAVVFTTHGAHLCTTEVATRFGRTWHLFANYSEAPGIHRSVDVAAVLPALPGTGPLLALADRALTALVLRQDRRALAGWRPDPDRLSGPPWDLYRPLVEELPVHPPSPSVGS